MMRPWPIGWLLCQKKKRKKKRKKKKKLVYMDIGSLFDCTLFFLS
jgi:hypothetical protein